MSNSLLYTVRISLQLNNYVREHSITHSLASQARNWNEIEICTSMNRELK